MGSQNLKLQKIFHQIFLILKFDHYLYRVEPQKFLLLLKPFKHRITNVPKNHMQGFTPMSDTNPTHPHLHPPFTSHPPPPFPNHSHPINLPLLKTLEHHSTNVLNSDFLVWSLLTPPLYPPDPVSSTPSLCWIFPNILSISCTRGFYISSRIINPFL